MFVPKIGGWDFGEEKYEGTKARGLWSFDPNKIDASLKIVFPHYFFEKNPRFNHTKPIHVRNPFEKMRERK